MARFPKGDPVPNADSLINCPRCQQIKDNGVRCGAPALRGKKLCNYHDRQRRTFPHRACYRKSDFCRRADFFNVRTPDDVMRAINEVINSLLTRQLSDKEANSILFALQTASIFAPHTTAARTIDVEPHVNHPITRPPDHPTLSPDHPMTRPRSVADFFDRHPGLDDIRAMLTPEDIAQLEAR